MVVEGFHHCPRDPDSTSSLSRAGFTEVQRFRWGVNISSRSVRGPLQTDWSNGTSFCPKTSCTKKVREISRVRSCVFLIFDQRSFKLESFIPVVTYRDYVSKKSTVTDFCCMCFLLSVETYCSGAES